MVLWVVLVLVLCWPVVSGLAAPAHVAGRQSAAGRTGSVAVVALRRQKLAHLTVTAATVNLLPGNVLTGTATVGNVGALRARAFTADVAWKSSRSGGLVQLGRFSVPALKPGQKHKAHFRIHALKGASGSYDVSVCANVLGQVQEQNKKNNCRDAGVITIGHPGSGVKGSGPTGQPPSPGSAPGGSSTPPPAGSGQPPVSSPPDTVIDSGPAGTIGQSSVTFTFHGTDTNDTFQCSLDGAPWATCTSPQQYTVLADGYHTFQVRAVNTSGEMDATPASTSFTVDTTAPVVSLASPAGGSATNHNKPSFSGSAGTAPGDLPAVTVKVYLGTSASGTPVQTLTVTASAGAWSVGALSALADGIYTAQASQSDEAGNAGTSSAVTFTVDTIPPAVTLTAPSAGTDTNNNKPVFSGAAGTEPGDSATVTLVIYKGTSASGTPAQTLTATDTSGHWSVTPATALTDGTYTAQATQADAAGNIRTSKAVTFTIDTTPPGSVTGVQATLAYKALRVTWTNPGDSDYAGALVRRMEGATPPTSPTSGTLVGEVSIPGGSIEDNTATPGHTYSYAVFAYDGARNYASAATTTAVMPACTIWWTGNAGSLEWSASGNWTGNRLPTTGDVVCITGSVIDPTITYSSSGTTSVAQVIATRPLEVSSGDLELTATATPSETTNLTLAGGTIGVSGELIIRGETMWSAGVFVGQGATALPAGSVLTVSNGGGCCQSIVSGATLTVAGELDLTGSSTVALEQSAKLVNTGTINFQGDGGITDNNGSDASSVASSGTIEKTGGSSTSVIGVNGSQAFDNTGSVKVTSGTLSIEASNSSGASDTGSYTASGSGSSIHFDSGTRVFGSGASVTGPGTFEVGGTLALEPGIANSVSSLSGGGTIQLEGTGNFGRLLVSGAASIGSLHLSVGSPSYTPGCGASATALTAGSVSGEWSGISGGALPPGGSWVSSVGASSAGAYVSCPVPVAPQAQTYGSGTSFDSFNPSGYQAEPVNTATGAYNTTETDASIPGLGAPFVFTRSYTSSNSYSGPHGRGWTDSLNVFLTPQSGGNVVLNSEDGQQTTFALQGDGSYTGGPGTRSTLSARSGGGWLLVRQNQERLTFDESGRLVSETDRNGIGLSLSYNGSGELTSVTDYAGRTVTFSYDSAGLLVSMSLPLGRTVSYGYNSSNQLTSVADAAGGVTSYEYNAEGLLASITNQDGHKIVTNTYDAQGRVVKHVNALGDTATFAYEGGTTTYTDPDGHAWKDIYSGNVLVERVDPTGGVTRYAYDSNLDKTAVTDPNGNTTTMSYDAAGNILSRTSPLEAKQTWTYDALNVVISYTDADRNTTSYSYDEKGNLLSTTYADGAAATEVHAPTTGALTSSTDALGHTTSYGYDAGGDLTSMISPLGEKTTYSYDAAGRRVATVSPRGNAGGANPSEYTTSYSYDANNRLIEVTDPDGNVTKTTYDQVGNRTSLTNPDGNTTSWGYDAQNQLTSVTDANGATTTYTYDANGNRISVTTPLGHTTTYAYDADGRLTMTTNPLANSTTYAYDADGHRISVTDAVGAKTSYEYNADGELTGVSYSDGTHAVTYSYDAAGNRTQMTDASGTTSYSYDARKRLTSLTDAQGTFSYSYDKNGNVTSRAYPDGSTVSETYDADGRLASVSADGQTMTYGYDADSQLTSTTLPSGNGYTETATYDPAGRLDSIKDSNGKGTLSSFAYTYDAAGNPTKVTTASSTITYGYDKDGWLTSACYGSSCAEGSIEYTYGADGERTKMTDTAGTTNYSYDSADELTTAEGPSATTSYSYDKDGRRTAAGETSYRWNTANELTELATPLASTSYGYDGDATRVSAATAGKTTSFAYDTNNSLPLLALEKSTTGSSRYVWGDGLLSMNTGGSDYYTAHDAQGSIVALTSSTGATESTYSYDPFGNALAAHSATGAPAMPLRYDAQYLDSTGLYHLGARQLDTTTGVFISQDPVAPLVIQPAISPYIYVKDRPTTLQDPTGQSSEGGGYTDPTTEAINQDMNVYHNNLRVEFKFALDVSTSEDLPAAYNIGVTGTKDAGELRSDYAVF
jgi:RHS repeat-associated protein